LSHGECLLLLLIHHFRINHAIVLLRILGLWLFAMRRLATGLALARLRGAGLVKFRAHGLDNFVQFLARRLDGGTGRV